MSSKTRPEMCSSAGGDTFHTGLAAMLIRAHGFDKYAANIGGRTFMEEG